jgi:hypothetical protein
MYCFAKLYTSNSQVVKTASHLCTTSIGATVLTSSSEIQVYHGVRSVREIFVVVAMILDVRYKYV